MRQSHGVIEAVVFHIAQLLDKGPCMVCPEILQHGTLRKFLLVQSVFQAQPQQPFVGIAVFILVKGFEKFCQFWVIIMLAGRADDAIPVQLCLTCLVEGLEVRAKTIVPSGVPDHIFRSLDLELGYLFHQLSNRSAAVSVPFILAAMISDTSWRSKSSKDLLMMPSSRACPILSPL